MKKTILKKISGRAAGKLLPAFLLLAATGYSQATIKNIAGNSSSGYTGDNGQAVSATLNQPYGVALDRNNLYIADWGNNVIRKVDLSTNIITTIAGTGTAGYNGDNGPATAAWLNGPENICIDNNGNIYFSEMYNHTIRMIDPSGIISTLAGDGTPTIPNCGSCGDGSPARAATCFNDIGGIAVDNQGNVFAGDPTNYSIRRIDHATNIITTVAGDPNHYTNGTAILNGDGGLASGSFLTSALGLAFDNLGNLYFADGICAVVRKINAVGGLITSSSTISRIAGTYYPGFSGDNNSATSAQLAHPQGVVVDPQGNIYISDQMNFRVRKIAAGTNIITTAVGTGNSTFNYSAGINPTSANLDFPYQLATDQCSNLYIADAGNNVIGKVMWSAVPSFSTTVSSSSHCSGSNIVATDTYTGIPDAYSWQLQSCNSSGVPDGLYNFNSGWINGIPPSSYTFSHTSNLACNKNYLITFSVKKNCPQLTVSSATQVIYIMCNPTPVISGNTNICKGGSTTLSENYSTGFPSLNQVHWSTGAVNTSSITVTPTVTTVYSVTVTTLGCSGAATTTVAVTDGNPDFVLSENYVITNNYFTVDATPVVTNVSGMTETWVVEQIDPNTGAAIAGTNTSTGTPSNPSCWQNIYPNTLSFPGFDGTKSSGINNVTCSTPSVGHFAAADAYKIYRTVTSTGCPSPATMTHTITASGHRMANPDGHSHNSSESNSITNSNEKIISDTKNALKIYPNPSSGLIKIDIGAETEVAYEIQDLYGKIIRSGTLQKTSELDLSEYAKGTYFIKTVYLGKSGVTKILLE